jgi:predicted GTPase
VPDDQQEVHFHLIFTVAPLYAVVDVISLVYLTGKIPIKMNAITVNNIPTETQVKARPPTFVVFVSGAGKIDDTELRFFASSLREDFGLGGVPIRVLQRSSRDTRAT